MSVGSRGARARAPGRAIAGPQGVRCKRTHAHMPGVLGGGDVFYLGRHGLKTYVCVRESFKECEICT